MLEVVGQQAKHASYGLSLCSTEQKNRALSKIAELLHQERYVLIEENNKDIHLARQNNMSEAMQDRLLLTEQRIQQIIDDLYNVIQLDDPVGRVMDQKILPNGLTLEKRCVPLGVIAAIYESRPNVTIYIASLCLKTGNAVILRGGKETLYTNNKLIELIQIALSQSDLPEQSVQFLHDPDRVYLKPLLQLDQYIDMIIPRGGVGLQRMCQELATIPVILGGIGVCHIFVDETADLKKALPIIDNAKTQRPSACNSLETLLVHQNIAEQFLPILFGHLSDKKVKFHFSSSDMNLLNKAILNEYRGNIFHLEQQQLTQEWLSLNLNVVLVEDIQNAISHIRQYGSAHSDAILTQDFHHANLFTQQVDSAAIFVNCSTRFTDGAQFGLGAEVAISTQKLHARGPMGLDALTTYKWIGKGDYLIRS